MQSACEDTLEERYAIKFCSKLGKNDATETYGMLQIRREKQGRMKEIKKERKQ